MADLNITLSIFHTEGIIEEIDYHLYMHSIIWGGVTKWVAHLIRYRSVVSSNPIKAPVVFFSCLILKKAKIQNISCQRVNEKWFFLLLYLMALDTLDFTPWNVPLLTCVPWLGWLKQCIHITIECSSLYYLLSAMYNHLTAFYLFLLKILTTHVHCHLQKIS